MHTDDTSSTAQQMPLPGEGDVPAAVTIGPVLSLGELVQVWTLDQTGVLERPKECNGESGGFDDFASKFSKWLSGLRASPERLLEASANMGQPILWATLAAREKVVARGVATALRALVGGIVLNCI